MVRIYRVRVRASVADTGYGSLTASSGFVDLRSGHTVSVILPVATACKPLLISTVGPWEVEHVGNALLVTISGEADLLCDGVR